MRSFRPLFAASLVVVACLTCACSPPRGAGGGPKTTPGPETDAACRALEADACRADPACVAIPYWGESIVACDVDERGFANNCPFEGCRAARQPCPTLAELSRRCANACGYNDYGIDPETGCRTCDCRHG